MNMDVEHPVSSSFWSDGTGARRNVGPGDFTRWPSGTFGVFRKSRSRRNSRRRNARILGGVCGLSGAVDVCRVGLLLGTWRYTGKFGISCRIHMHLLYLKVEKEVFI